MSDIPTAGVELEQSVCGLGDGGHKGARLFSCAPGRALFVPLPLCRRDARFRDTPPPEPLRDERYDQVGGSLAAFYLCYRGNKRAYGPVTHARNTRNFASGLPTFGSEVRALATLLN